MTDSETLKREAAERAVAFVRSGMVVGLGTGSTAVWAVRRIGALLAAGQLEGVVGAATHRDTARPAAAFFRGVGPTLARRSAQSRT